MKSARNHAEGLGHRWRGAALGVRSIASIADQGASAAITFLSSVFVGRLLGAGALGIFAMTSALVLIIRQAQAGVVLDPMSVFGARRRPTEKRRYLGFIAALQLLWVGGLTGVAAIAAGLLWFGALIDDDSFHAVLASLLFANVVAAQYLVRRQFYVDEMPERALVQSLASLALSVLGLALYAATSQVSLVGVYFVLAGCSLAVCLVQGERLLAQVRWPSRHERNHYFSEHWHFGGWTLLTVPLSMACYQGYFFVSGGILSIEDAGYLKAADALVAPFSQVVIGVSLMFVPIVARRLDAMAGSTQVRFALRLCAGAFVIAAAYAGLVFLFGTDVIELVFGQHLAAAGEVVRAMALVPLFIAVGVPAGILLAAHRRPDLRFAAYGGASLITLLVGFILVALTGIQGAAWGLVLSQAALSAALWVAFLRHQRTAGAPTTAGGALPQ